MKTRPNTVLDEEFYIMFQDSVDRGVQASSRAARARFLRSWVIYVKLGSCFALDKIPEYPNVLSVMLSAPDFDQFRNWSSLCAYHYNWHTVRNFPWFCVKELMFDNFIGMLDEMAEAARKPPATARSFVDEHLKAK